MAVASCQSPDICHLSPAARRTDGRSRATVPIYINSRLHYAHHILCHGVCGNVSVAADGGKKLIVLLETYYLYWMRGHPKVVWSVDGRGTIEKTPTESKRITTYPADGKNRQNHLYTLLLNEFCTYLPKIKVSYINCFLKHERALWDKFNYENNIKRKYYAPCILMTSSFLNNFKYSRYIKLIVANVSKFEQYTYNNCK